MNNGALLKPNTLFQTLISSSSPLLHSNKTSHAFFSIQLPKHKLLSFHVKLSSGSPVFASKTSRKGETSIPETENSDFEDEFDEEFEEDDEDEEEEEDIFVPLRNMRQWTRNKPQGFGEGKVYDTSVEDKLLEELEQSRVAQVANVTNLKLNPEDGNPNSKKEKLPKQKVPEPIPDGVRVRLINLPKKKNIHRDLQAAFKPFSGIINIIPAVLGNEKTREPVCKGFAFVDFKSDKEAKRFVDFVSTEPITFGKIQKQIRCEIVKPTTPNPDPVKPPLPTPLKSLPITNPGVTLASPNPVTETPFDSYVEDAAFDTLKNGDEIEIDDEFVKIDNAIQVKDESEIGLSEPLKKEKKVGEKGKSKKKITKKKVETKVKLDIPGSAKGLKTKDKALLSGVFSKYGGKSAVVGKGTEVE